MINEVIFMNTDILKGKWKQIKGTVTEEWGKLTDDEVDQVNGEFEQLSGLIQERYGYSKDEAEDAIDQFVKRCE